MAPSDVSDCINEKAEERWVFSPFVWMKSVAALATVALHTLQQQRDTQKERVQTKKTRPLAPPPRQTFFISRKIDGNCSSSCF